jgi:hypothetical protein
MRQSYSYLDDRVTVTRPHALREILAVKALRTGRWPLPHPPNLDVMKDVEKMIEGGWKRSEKQFQSFKDDIRIRNEATVRRILNDA